jgi:hypothetical protein
MHGNCRTSPGISRRPARSLRPPQMPGRRGQQSSRRVHGSEQPDAAGCGLLAPSPARSRDPRASLVWLFAGSLHLPLPLDLVKCVGRHGPDSWSGGPESVADGTLRAYRRGLGRPSAAKSRASRARGLPARRISPAPRTWAPTCPAACRSPSCASTCPRPRRSRSAPTPARTATSSTCSPAPASARTATCSQKSFQDSAGAVSTRRSAATARPPADAGRVPWRSAGLAGCE